MVLIMSWNVRGVISSTVSLCSLLDNTDCDVAVISEHKLRQSSSNFFDSMHGNYNGYVKLDQSNYDSGNSFIGKGGVAILVNKSLNFSVTEVSCYDSDRVVGIQLVDNQRNYIYIFGVYMPSENDIDSYMHHISILESLYNYYSVYGNVVLAGDMNASCLDSYGVNSAKCRILKSFVETCDLCIPMIDVDVKGESHTFVVKQTMLDYIFVPKSNSNNLLSYKIFEEGSICMTSDHLPILVEIQFNCLKHYLTRSTTSLPAWHRASALDIDKYRDSVHVKLFELKDRDLTSVSEIDQFFSEFTQILRECA
ncbi:hypothetical protein FSP39_022522 [Pinctada imbricata]|uniref:Endonuclease/exonuclease/phosphatase domain-containing protein n=1 Tax=Pinctada imbricata TaxID=66713 RepID=A0AA88YFF0_PINIB|nr:hypothetical protein FSP39_022522 [Pinctada imbricata]